MRENGGQRKEVAHPTLLFLALGDVDVILLEGGYNFPALSLSNKPVFFCCRSWRMSHRGRVVWTVVVLLACVSVAVSLSIWRVYVVSKQECGKRLYENAVVLRG